MVEGGLQRSEYTPWFSFQHEGWQPCRLSAGIETSVCCHMGNQIKNKLTSEVFQRARSSGGGRKVVVSRVVYGEQWYF